MGTAIKVENLGKQYRLGEVGTGTLSHDLNRWMAKIRGKEDPFSKIGEANDRTKKGNSDYVWALENINFDVQAGEVLGIIGRNGAGKSTLLKILSKVTKPTTGQIKTRGRIASLLEVGTGFHPEMTGRENVFLNGAIMGMTKTEIKRKFDEIVEFAGVERYIDTPVKRYSSGMYVRLGFAVAAHLEPEILIVDEVLAVGDAEFQKKCLGKMKDVSVNDGRTVLFVSHNMSAVQNLCTKCVFLANGTVKAFGNTDKIISTYLKSKSDTQLTIGNRKDRQGDQKIHVSGIAIKDLELNEKEHILSGDSFIIEVKLAGDLRNLPSDFEFSVSFNNSSDERLTFVSNMLSADKLTPQNNNIYIRINKIPLPPGEYWLGTFIRSGGVIHDWVSDAFCIEIELDNYYVNGTTSISKGNGYFYLDYKYL